MLALAGSAWFFLWMFSVVAVLRCFRIASECDEKFESSTLGYEKRDSEKSEARQSLWRANRENNVTSANQAA